MTALSKGRGKRSSKRRKVKTLSLPQWFLSGYPREQRRGLTKLLKEVETEFKRLHEEGFSLAKRKQLDYGPENISDCGLAGVTVRMNDKMARLRNLVLNKREPSNESLRDSFIDMQNYGTIGLMVMDGTWPKSR